MTQDQLFEALNRFSLRAPIFGTVQISFEKARDGAAVWMYVSSCVLDRNTLKPATIQSRFPFYPYNSGSYGQLGYMIRARVLQMLKHELDEMLCFDGQILKDPHDAPR